VTRVLSGAVLVGLVILVVYLAPPLVFLLEQDLHDHLIENVVLDPAVVVGGE